MDFKALVPSFFKKKTPIVRSTENLVDNEHPELSAITAKIAELVAQEAAAAAAHKRVKEQIADFQSKLKATVDSHLADLKQLYGESGEK